MNGDRGSSKIPGALGEHPTGSFVTANIFFVKPPHTAIEDKGSTSQGAHHRRLL
jgi:hypothetical protein